MFGIEGCGQLRRGSGAFLAERGGVVFECERPRRGERRGGKNDLIDAALAARRVVSGEGLSLPRGGGESRAAAPCSCSSGVAPCRRAPPRSTSLTR